MFSKCVYRHVLLRNKPVTLSLQLRFLLALWELCPHLYLEV